MFKYRKQTVPSTSTHSRSHHSRSHIIPVWLVLVTDQLPPPRICYGSSTHTPTKKAKLQNKNSSTSDRTKAAPHGNPRHPPVASETFFWKWQFIDLQEDAFPTQDPGWVLGSPPPSVFRTPRFVIKPVVVLMSNTSQSHLNPAKWCAHTYEALRKQRECYPLLLT